MHMVSFIMQMNTLLNFGQIQTSWIHSYMTMRSLKLRILAGPIENRKQYWRNPLGFETSVKAQADKWTWCILHVYTLIKARNFWQGLSTVLNYLSKLMSPTHNSIHESVLLGSKKRCWIGIIQNKNHSVIIMSIPHFPTSMGYGY